VHQRATGEARITAAAFRALAFDGVPYADKLGCRIERFEAGLVTVRMPWQELLRRPGGTICGPALMALADVTLYGVVLSIVGKVALAVTTDMTFHFLSRPAPRDVLASGRLLKLGRRLAVGEVTMHSDGEVRAICHAVGTYAIPPEAGPEEIDGQDPAPEPGNDPDTALTAGDLRPR
jgi:uncharacterized protein (TIGR00369 family)